MPLRDDTVSRFHAEIDVMTPGLRIRDLRSTNGTYLADREGAIALGFLWPGARFRVGETWIRVAATDEAVEAIDLGDAAEPAEPRVQFGGLVGSSPAMQTVFRRALHLAQGSGCVLLVGPVGSGRHAVARQMQRVGPRAHAPFVTVDAATDSAAALFGRNDHPSALLRADKGTLLLRNVDRLPRRAQGTLRDVLERGTLRPEDHRRLDVRILATCRTARDIEPRLRRHLAVATLRIPSLNKRAEEVVPLAEHFLRGAGWENIRLGPRTREKLYHGGWPDELVGLCRLVQRLPLPPEPADHAVPRLAAVRTAFLSDLLAEHSGDVSAASADLSVPTRELFRTLHTYNVDID